MFIAWPTVLVLIAWEASVSIVSAEPLLNSSRVVVPNKTASATSQPVSEPRTILNYQGTDYERLFNIRLDNAKALVKSAEEEQRRLKESLDSAPPWLREFYEHSSNVLDAYVHYFGLPEVPRADIDDEGIRTALIGIREYFKRQNWTDRCVMQEEMRDAAKCYLDLTDEKTNQLAAQGKIPLGYFEIAGRYNLGLALNTNNTTLPVLRARLQNSEQQLREFRRLGIPSASFGDLWSQGLLPRALVAKNG